MQTLPLSKRIIAPGDPNAKYGPFDSLNDFFAFLEEELIDITPSMTVSIKQSNGTYKEFWNNNSNNLRNFVEKQAANTAISQGNSDTYIIKAEDWGLTIEDMQQDANKHYTSIQYDKMYQNGIGISNAIKHAYSQGYRRAVLERGTYCFCASMPQNVAINFPQIFLNDINDFTFDLNGSTLKLCIDDTQYSTHFLNHNEPVWDQRGIIIGLFYCRRVDVCNGTLIGDRFTRSYSLYIKGEGAKASECEKTCGIMVFAGCQNIDIHDIEAREFMGDGICGYSILYYDNVNNADEADHFNANIKFIPSPKATHSYYINDNLTENKNIADCAITDYIDVSKLYNEHNLFSNRIKDKEEGIYQLNFPLGYVKMSSCYPLEIEVLTYRVDQDGNKILTRKIRSSYLSTFRLTKEEKFIRLLYIHEDNIFPAYDESKTYVYYDKICREADNVIVEYECLSSFSDTEISNMAQDETDTIGVPSKDASKWRISRVCAPGTAVTFSKGTKYMKGKKVTYNIGKNYLCYMCTVGAGTTGEFKPSDWKFTETTRIPSPEVTHDVAVFEFISSDVSIRNCRIINNHRGGIANLNHNSVIDNCFFSKHYKVANDGFPAPNPGNNLTCDGGFEWSTIYHIDIEDWYAQNIKIKNCRFEPSSAGAEKVLVGCLTAEISGCQGFVSMNFMSCQYINIHDNVFDKLNLSVTTQNLTYNRDSSCRFVTRDFIFHNNRILSGFWVMTHEDGQRLKITNNFIYEDFVRSTLDGGLPKYGLSDIFSNNTVVSNKNTPNNPVSISVSGYNTQGTTIDTTGCVNLFSPMCGDMMVNTYRTSFGESPKDRLFKRLNITASEEITIVINTDPNDAAKKIIKFVECDFKMTNGFKNLLCLVGMERNNKSQQFDIYFDRCTFDAISYNLDLINFKSDYINGDKINLYFDSCEFTTNNASLCNKSGCFEIKKFFNCTSNKALTCNGNAIS